MPDETPTEGEMIPPIVDYVPEAVTPEDPPLTPSTPPSEDGSPIVAGPTYPAPGEAE